MFRRRPPEAPGEPEADEQPEKPEPRPRSSVTPPKGAPTPKRSEAQGSRRQPYQAPADRKAASRQSRERGRDDRTSRSAAYARGEQWALPAKDQGPVRALARDVVDSRRSIGEYYMILVLVLVVLLVVPSSATKLIADFLVIFLLAVMLIEGLAVARKIRRLAAERFPGQSTQGVTMYAVTRGISMRRMRMPKPRVKPGDQI